MRIHLASLLLALAATLFTGCGSKEVADYMPDCPVYIGFNVQKAVRQPGMAELKQMMEIFDPGGKNSADWVHQIMVGVNPADSTNPKFYMTATGNGDLTTWMDEITGVEFKIKRIPVSVSKPKMKKTMQIPGSDVMAMRLKGDRMMIASNKAALTEMEAAAKKNKGGGTRTAAFTACNQMIRDHAVTVAIDPSAAAAMGPGAAMAGGVSMVTIFADWTPALKIEAQVKCKDQATAQAMSAMASMGIQQGMAQMASVPDPSVAAAMNALRNSKVAADGDTMSVIAEIPEEAMSGVMDKFSEVAMGMAMGEKPEGLGSLMPAGGLSLPAGSGSLPAMATPPASSAVGATEDASGMITSPGQPTPAAAQPVPAPDPAAAVAQAAPQAVPQVPQGPPPGTGAMPGAPPGAGAPAPGAFRRATPAAYTPVPHSWAR